MWSYSDESNKTMPTDIKYKFFSSKAYNFLVIRLNQICGNKPLHQQTTDTQTKETL